MAFWTRKPAAENPIPPELKDQLDQFPLTKEIGARALNALVSKAQWFSLPGGTVLPREGENDNALFVVVSGMLGIYTRDDADRDQYVASIPAGETVGEMSLISGEAHSAKIVALRDTQLLRISKEAFEGLLVRHPRLGLNLMRILVRRLRHTTRRAVKGERVRTIALVPLHEGVDCRGLAAGLQRALAGLSMRCETVGKSAGAQAVDWFEGVERKHDMVLYAGDEPNGPFTQFCLRQADRVLMIAREGEALPSHPLAGAAEGRLRRQMPELVILRAPDASGAGSVPSHVTEAYALHHFMRFGNTGDAARLARHLTGRAVGIVLAGGGARGFAHIGALRALREAGVPFDLVGGSSMGAIIAASLAMGWDDKEIEARIRRSFVDTNPLSDVTLPLVALFRGEKVSRLLRDNFGDTAIEGMPLPYFCVSSDLSHGRSAVHRSGPLWRALRASVAIPGLLPPVVEDGRLLVDGGLMNNFPVDVMAGLTKGPIIGIDVAGDEDFRATTGDLEGRTWWGLARDQMRGGPSIVSILMRSGTVGNEAQRREARARADLLLTPQLPGIGLRSWKAYETVVEMGYANAAEAIERDGLDFLWAVRGAG